MGTIHHCCKRGNDVNKSLSIVYEAPTHAEAIKWLEMNGGGVYRNILHGFSYPVSPERKP